MTTAPPTSTMAPAGTDSTTSTRAGVGTTTTTTSLPFSSAVRARGSGGLGICRRVASTTTPPLTSTAIAVSHPASTTGRPRRPVGITTMTTLRLGSTAVPAAGGPNRWICRFVATARRSAAGQLLLLDLHWALPGRTVALPPRTRARMGATRGATAIGQAERTMACWTTALSLGVMRSSRTSRRRRSDFRARTAAGHPRAHLPR
mmetsp:Transcript_50014/g.138922  ORF Transcript_50014/g.138922 Transcript_50014/m.138922 type:complete len:204 (-) Transcript_50014:85-696(-)